ncbi:hypothetical protein NOV72_00161 [Caballeronia novacaledonica]|uniref:Uncharacterized protein n=1 Tax=Caballeronia novacaledonica TaxID=1544861 RepID=A0A2U3HYI6_9BURK|nr:hypothetical protein [Caballeronia novacaledonica]SPB12857.1 hypothetical protein NOV72_00161 [Caballeronia novacaledonica]
MRARTREVVRMLATFRHSAHCRRLRDAAAAQQARDLANEPSDDDATEEDERADPETFIVVRKPHPDMH